LPPIYSNLKSETCLKKVFCGNTGIKLQITHIYLRLYRGKIYRAKLLPTKTGIFTTIRINKRPGYTGRKIFNLLKLNGIIKLLTKNLFLITVIKNYIT
jgi:hypothetical protein